MQQAKLRLSQREIDIATDRSLILTKNRIISGTTALFQAVQQEYKQIFETHATGQYAALGHNAYKISRGENYLGYPWVMLDYPRSFEKQNIFAIRTLFWWGHFFSLTLHVAGRWKPLTEANLVPAINELKKRNFYLCIASDQWQHHFEKENYINLKKKTEKSITKIFSAGSFIKLSKKYPIKQWDFIADKLVDDFKALVRITQI